MAEVNLSLAGLFEKVFGLSFDPDFKPVIGDVPSISRLEAGVFGTPYYANDANGMEYFLPVTMTYVVNGPNSSDVKKWNLPYPVISISNKKKWVETPLTERKGTVKQYINTGDYDIRIKGFIIAQTNELPQDDIATLRELYEGMRVSISNALTDIFLLRPDRSGSDDVVIKEINLPEVQGIKNVRPYELILVSDAPFNLIDLS